ncbi:MAG: glycosyl hydrolase family 28 protein [Planctomycetes bacterium]|nr:glycosyl hydrolase family 28 protein [Planctomycetota bacterium]
MVLFCCLLAGSALAEDVSILDCGAVPDGMTLATPAIQKAIDRCAAAGGGTVTVPAGRFLTHTVFLKSNVNLHLGQGAVLLGSTDPKAFTQAVVYANGIENASITGPGTIDGQGFKKYYPPKGPRHNDIRLFRSKRITVRDVTLVNSPSWVFRILECDTVSVRGVRIYSFANENNDGIDIDGKNITISDCIIDCDDDAVCLKSDNPSYLVENIAIANCVIASNCNAIKFGTSSRCGFRNVSIGNCVIRRPSEAAQRHWAVTIPGVTRDDTVISGLALEVVDGGAMDQIAVTNISMTGVQTPLFIRLGGRNGPGALRNVVISNITATNESLITSSITGIPGSYVENVTVRDVIFTYKGTGTLAQANALVPEKEATYPENRMFGPSLPAYGLYVRHVKNLVFENFRFNRGAPDARPAVLLDDCHNVKLIDFDVATPSNDQPLVRLIQSTNITLSGYQSLAPVARFVQVEGKASSGIKLAGNDLTGVRSVVTLGEGCEESAIKEWNNLR